MIYDCIETLPDSVKAALDEEGQKQWMTAFNKTVKKSKSKKAYREAVFDAWEVVKNYPGCRYFSGFVSTEDLDKQNDVVEVEKAYERIAKHVERGGTMVDTHTNRTVGAFVYVKKTNGKTGKPGIKAYSVIYQGEPYYNAVWDQIKKGQECPDCRDVRKGFSIGGFALETRHACDASGCHREILDMSIHEISICQDPANPEAVIQEVNMMAKSENKIGEEDNEISKALRTDVPEEVEEDVNPEMMEGQGGQKQESEMKEYIKVLKEMQAAIKDYRKFADEYNKFKTELQVAGGGIGGAVPGVQQPMMATAKAEGIVTEKSCGCGKVDEDVHTPIDGKCPEKKELYGDVKDPQVKDSAEFLENKGIEADPAVKKDHGELMPGKDGFDKEIDFKDAKEGPAYETKVMEGFSKLEPKNASITVPDEHIKEDMKEEQTIIDAAENMKAEDEEALEKTEEKKHSNCDCQTADKFKKKFEPNGAADKTITDSGDIKEKNFGKEGKELMMKDGKAEIPEELMPMFREFLAEKGIKMEPEVPQQVEAVVEKTIYIDDDISEMDLKELSDGVIFDSSIALGKTATQKLRIHNMDTRMRLAKSLKIVDIEYIAGDSKKN